MPTLVELVRAKDYTACLAVRGEGPAAVPALLGFANDRDSEVRELALHCLDEVGGPGAERAFCVGLLDRDAQVRSAAMKGAGHHCTNDSIEALNHAYEQSPEAVVRENVMLILGALPGMEAAKLRGRWEREKLPLAQDGGRAALARLGDPKAQEEFSARLLASTGAERVRLFEYAGYIRQPFLLKTLLPILDDAADGLRIGADGVAECPYALKFRDMAVNLAFAISRHRFTFEVLPNVNYIDSQVAEVRQHLAGLK